MIDAHQHFWKFTVEEFGWLEGGFSSLRRDFLPGDLKETLAGTPVDGVVSVQARRTLVETRWLLELAAQEKLIRGVVGWVPLKDESIGDLLDELRTHAALKGVREVLQGEPDADFLAHPDFDRGIRELTRRGIPYDLLIFQDQLPAATRFVQRHPDQVFILDHMGKPEIRREFAAGWARDIRALAALGNVACKVSGVVTEVREAACTADLIRPYFDVVREAFGPERLLYGSDWPVCLARAEYRAWLGMTEQFAAAFSPDERRQFFEGTAQRIYRL